MLALPRDPESKRPTASLADARSRPSVGRRSIRAVVIDDCLAVRTLLCMILEQDPDMTVVGAAADGRQGLELVKRLRPDVVTMDLTMPGLGGLEAIAAIMREAPTRVIVISASTGPSGTVKSLEAVRAGALAVLPGLPNLRSDDFAAQARTIRDVVRSSASVRLALAGAGPSMPVHAQIKAVVLGWASARTAPLQRIVASLPLHAEAPVLVVCDAGDDPRVVASTLLPTSALVVRAVLAAQPLLPGSVYVLGPHGAIETRHGVQIAVPGGALVGDLSGFAPAFGAIAKAFSGQVLAVLPAAWDGRRAQIASELIAGGCRVVAALADAPGAQQPVTRGDTVASIADLTLPAQMLGPYVRKQLAQPTSRAA
jgi:two-component system chemotaxis response regulator CheB